MCRASRRPRPLILRESGPAAFGCFVFVSALLAICVALMTPMPTWANPAGGTVISGGGTINQAPGATTITQTTDKTIIKWNSFNIANGELTQFIQPNANAIVLNRIVGGASVIDGRVLANGNVWLVNQNGILFGKNASIDVHGLLATTADIRDSDFMSGRFNFSIASPNPGASIINQGTISIGEAGLGGLVAPYVRNDGVIVGNLGQVILAGAPTFTLDFYGDGLIQFAATSKVLDAATPVVQNNGKISADGGQVLITANAAAGVVNESINVGGVVEARSFSAKNGTIILDGGENGAVRVTGTLDASGASAGQTGGTIKVLGDKVTVAEGAKLDASGYSGGGTVLVGGNFGGKGPERNASATTVEKNATILADATVSGDGGKVAVWSNGQTDFYGTIFARGGSVGGNGGFAEISGKTLNKHGRAYLTAANGKVGTLLLDPTNFIYDTAAEIADLNNDLTTADVILNTYKTPDLFEPGNITINAPGSTVYLSGHTLTLNAANDIYIGSSIGDGTAGNFSATAVGTLNVNSQVSAGGAVNLNGVGGLLINADVSAANFAGYGASINLGARVTAADRIYLQGGTVAQTAAGILTGNHLGISANSASLASASNNVQVLAANVAGNLSFNNSGTLSIGEFAYSAPPIVGITTNAGGTTSITAPDISVDKLIFSSGDVTLHGTGSIGVNDGITAPGMFLYGGNITLGASSTLDSGHSGNPGTNKIYLNGNTITQASGGTITGRLLGVEAASAALNGSNSVGNLAAKTTSGNFSLNNTVDLNISNYPDVPGLSGITANGNASVTTTTVNVTSGNGISATGNVTMNGSAAVNVNADVSGANISANGGDVTLAANLTSGDRVYLSGRYVTQPSGRISGNHLGISSVTATLEAANNSAQTLAANVSGNLSYVNSGDLSIGDAAGLSGITGGSATVTATGSRISVDRAISETGDVTLNGPGGIDVNGTISGDKIYLGGGAVTQSAAGAISGNQLGVRASSATLGATNNVRHLAADVGGSLTFNNTGTLGIDQYTPDPTLTGVTTTGNATIASTSITVSNAISAPTGDVALYANGGDMTLAANLTSGDKVYLSGGNITQSGGRISGNVLGVNGAAATLESATNSVQRVAANTTGNFSYTNSGTLNVGQYSAGLSGITSGGTVALTSTAGAVAQNSSGTITADNLAVSAASGITLDQAVNRVNTLAASVTGAGSISFLNGGSLTVGQVNGVSGIRTASGNIRVALNSGNLTVNQAINAGNGAVTLLDTAGTVTLNNSITAGRNLGDAGSGSAYSILVAGNSFVNNYGPAALNPGSGRYLIYTNDVWNYDGSQDQWDIMRGNLTGFDKRYGFSYVASNPDGSLHSDGAAVNTTSNYFFYSFRPALTFTANTNNRYYRSTDPAWTFTAVGGLIDHDTLDTAGAAYLADMLLRPGGFHTNSNFNSPPGLYYVFFDVGTFYSPINYSLGFVGGKLRIVPPFPQMMATEKTINSNLVLTYEIPLTKEEVHLFPEDDSLKLWDLTQK